MHSFFLPSRTRLLARASMPTTITSIYIVMQGSLHKHNCVVNGDVGSRGSYGKMVCARTVVRNT